MKKINSDFSYNIYIYICSLCYVPRTTVPPYILNKQHILFGKKNITEIDAKIAFRDAHVVHSINHVSLMWNVLTASLHFLQCVLGVFQTFHTALPLFRILFVIYFGFHLGQMMNVRTRIFAYKWAFSDTVVCGCLQWVYRPNNFAGANEYEFNELQKIKQWQHNK